MAAQLAIAPDDSLSWAQTCNRVGELHLIAGQRETTPIGGVTEYVYDAAGSRTSKLDAKGQVTTFAYDDNERLTDIGYDDATAAAFEYDVRGNRILESGLDSTRDMQHDALGRLESVTDVTLGRDLEYAYDASGQRSSMTVLPDGEATTYAYDARGLLLRMTDAEGGEYRFGYDALGRRTASVYPNGMTLEVEYDALSRVSGMEYRAGDSGGEAGAAVEGFGYTYDSRGNRTAKVFENGSSETYGYDELSRLTHVAYASGREVAYEYDAVGNRTQMTEGTSGIAASCLNDQDCDSFADSIDNCALIANSQTNSDTSTFQADGALSVWRFEEASGTTAVDSMGLNHGNLINGVGRTTEGRFGSALEFDGVNDAMLTPINIDQTGAVSVTMEAWVYPTSSTSARREFMSTDNGGFDWSIGHQNGTWLVFTGENTRVTGLGVELNQWQHIAAVFEPAQGRVRFYKNGAAVVLGFIGTDASDQNLTLGQNPGLGEHFQGRIDEAAVWTRALTAAEVGSHARQGLFGDLQGDACDACPFSVDASCAPSTCRDDDGDGYGLQGASACAAGEVALFDCDDEDATVHPGAVEACDTRDNDCDGRLNEGCLANAVTTTYAYNAFNQLTSLTGPGGVTEFTYDANGNQTSKVSPAGTVAYAYDARDRLVGATVSAGAPTSCAGDADCDGVLDASDNCPQVSNASQADSEPFLPGTVSHWHFDEASGTTARDAADGNHGTLASGVTRVAGSPGRGQGLSLNGAAGGVQLPASASLNISNTITIEAWVKRPEFGGGAIVSKDNHYMFGIRADGLLTWADSTDFNSTNFGGHGGVPQDTWTHLVATKTGSTVNLYMNGGLVVSRAWFGGLTQNANAARVGPGFTGTLDEVAIYNRALTGEEVSARAAAGRTGRDGIGDACDACPVDPAPACGTTMCTDADGDGYGALGGVACGANTALDCDDADLAVHPGAVEELNGQDDDCDGRIDDAAVGASVTYGYDTQGLRVRVQDATGTRRVLLDGVEELAEYDAGTGTRVARYDHDASRIDALLGQVGAGGAKVHAVTDALGSVYGLTDGGVEVVSRYSYDVYGARSASSEAVATKWGFTGRSHEQGVAGLGYSRVRYLDTQTGRWLSADPLGFIDGPHRYGYVRGNPVAFSDPLGLFIQIYCEPVITSGDGAEESLKRLAAILVGYAAVGDRLLHCYVRVGCANFDLSHGQCTGYDRKLELLGTHGEPGPGLPQDVSWAGEIAAGTEAVHFVERTPSLGCSREDCILGNYQSLLKNLPDYDPFGPNSNTFAAALTTQCGMYVFWPNEAAGAEQPWPR